ncbi:hypothetical protein ACVNIS_11550 [Sphaerotilaceae bacterium SBD11-9]
MTSQSRDTLRDFFGEGKLPTKDHFGDLIDSMLNMRDEGFRKSIANGFEVSTPVGHDALISFYRDQRPKTALWSVRYGGQRDQLLFQPGNAAAQVPPVLALDAQSRVGINTAEPRHALDVAGVVACEGRTGSSPLLNPQPLLANGEWQDLTVTLHGCQALEVMAGVGAPGAGRYALMHTVAMNTFNPTAGWLDFLSRRKRIRCDHAYFGRRCDKLQLRWQGTNGRDAAYRLQVRTGCDYGDDVRIQAQITRLWFDETMRGGAP